MANIALFFPNANRVSNRVMWWICVKSVWFNLNIYCQPSVRIYLKLSYWKSLKN